MLCLVAQSCPTLCDSMDCSPPGSSIHGDSPGKNTGVGCHVLLQGIFPTQGSNPSLLHCRWFFTIWAIWKFQFTQSWKTLCDPTDCSMLGFPIHHQLPKLTQTHVHRVSEAIQPSHPLSSPSPLAFNISQHQGLFQWVSSLHQVAKILEFQLQHQFFQWIFRTDFL